MKYAIFQVSNGNFALKSEWSDLNSAIVNFHTICTILWNATDVEKACLAIFNSDMQLEKIEYIKYNTSQNEDL